MAFIKRIAIEGFQSHSDTDIELSPGVNILIGSTGSGKTAIARAIKWVMRNKSPGKEDGFIHDDFRKDRKPCTVTLWLSNGKIITRRKGPSINEYKITKIDNDYENVYSSFGKEVPAEVLEALESIPVDFGENIKIDLNFGNQHDAPFLLSDTARVPAVVFGHMIGLDQIDAATRLTSKQRRSELDSSKRAEKAMEELDIKIDALPDIDTAKSKAETVGNKIEESDKIEMRKLTLEGYNERIRFLIKEKNRLNKKMTAEEGLGLLKERTEKLDDIDIDIFNLRLMQTNVSKYRIDIGKLRRKLEPEQRVRDLIGKVLTIDGMISSLVNFETLADSIRSAAKRVKETEAATKIETTALKEKIDKIENILVKGSVLKQLRIGIKHVEDETMGKISFITCKKENIKEEQALLKNLLKDTDICPLSGGEFFDSCKNLIESNK